MPSVHTALKNLPFLLSSIFKTFKRHVCEDVLHLLLELISDSYFAHTYGIILFQYALSDFVLLGLIISTTNAKR